MNKLYSWAAWICMVSLVSAPALAKPSGGGGGRGGSRSSRGGYRSYSRASGSSTRFSTRASSSSVSSPTTSAVTGVAARDSLGRAFSSAPNSYRVGNPAVASSAASGGRAAVAPRDSAVSPTASFVGATNTYTTTTFVRNGGGGGYFYPGYLAFGFAPVGLYAGFGGAYPYSGYPATYSDIYVPSPIVETPAAPPPIPGAATASADLINAQGPPPPPPDPVQTFQLGDRAIVQVTGSVRPQDAQTALVMTPDGRTFLTHFDPSIPGAQDFAASSMVTVWLTPDSDGSYHLYQLKWLQPRNAAPAYPQPPQLYPQQTYPQPGPPPAP